MAIEIFNCIQGSERWFRARMGIPTASFFSDILAKGRGGERSKTRDSYMRKLAAETITEELGETFKSSAMDRGNEMEAEARAYYALMHDADPELVGFVRNGDKGASPDALIESNGGLELKTQRADLLIETLDHGARDPSWIPPEHVAQVQGNLWITEREWFDLCIYWPKMPIFTRRVYRDNAYIMSLAASVRQFNDELAEMVERIRSYARAS
jgi:hypothetical protein